MKFGKYVVLQFKVAFSSSLVIGLVLGILILVSGGAEGSITLDIELSASDSVWFLLAAPAIVTLLFLIFSPLSFFVYTAISRVWGRRFGHDV